LPKTCTSIIMRKKIKCVQRRRKKKYGKVVPLLFISSGSISGTL
jgi:hypothetical protein